MPHATQHIWPSAEQYILARPCPTCAAPVGAECRFKRHRPEAKFHARRTDSGINHYNRDVGKAPWLEDREPGRCYCTITPCPLQTP